MNILVLAGLAIFLGILCGKIFQRFKIPQVVGYIVVGVLIGKSFLHVMDGVLVDSLIPLVNFTLGVIGCVIGTELKSATFRKFGKTIYAILFSEGILSFLAVAAFVTLLTRQLYLGLLLGAIASATDPASTINVLWEYKAKGPLTRTLTSVIALDDGLALILYGLVSVFSKSLVLHERFSLFEGLALPILEIAGCFSLGYVVAVVTLRILDFIKEETLSSSFVLSVVALLTGLAVHWRLDLILVTMSFGMTMANMRPYQSDKIFGLIRQMATSLYILFFVVVGAKLDVHVFTTGAIIALVLVYLVSRSAGKIFGAMIGGIMTRAKKEVTLYSGVCLFTQGGVAMGLALSVSQNLAEIGPQGVEAGALIINVVAATTFIVQLIGPPLVKWGIGRAKETDRNITKEDMIARLTARDVMRTDIIMLQHSANMGEMIRTVRAHDQFYYPIIDPQRRLMGIVSMLDLKDALLNEDLRDIVVAKDIVVPSHAPVTPETPLADIYEIFQKKNIDFLPVVRSQDDATIQGVLQYRSMNQTVERLLLEVLDGVDG